MIDEPRYPLAPIGVVSEIVRTDLRIARHHLAQPANRDRN